MSSLKLFVVRWWRVILTILLVLGAVIFVVVKRGEVDPVPLLIMFAVQAWALVLRSYVMPEWGFVFSTFFLFFGVGVWGRSEVSLVPVWFVTGAGLIYIWREALAVRLEDYFEQYEDQGRLVGDGSDRLILPFRSFLPGIGMLLVLCFIYGFLAPLMRHGADLHTLLVDAGLGILIGSVLSLVGFISRSGVCFIGAIIAAANIGKNFDECVAVAVFVWCAGYIVAILVHDASVTGVVSDNDSVVNAAQENGEKETIVQAQAKNPS